ncbi:immunoglobulin lambda-1 light chain isoform X3 [Parambassis ranga]|uniref:immunoglobulin lambda-1 light chain isoform X3 n=1 Tax=Parambassis ranga TaxID=210632 RepID=UPI001041F62E|nr:immunoglobulin lambda-1 light chain-like isoform X3 [Parambassis ranga]
MTSPEEIYAFICFFSCQVSAVTFQQSPAQIVKGSSEVYINCSHDDSTLLVMLWYQQRSDSTAMTLIGYGYETAPNYEGQFEEQFKLTRQGVAKGALVVLKAEQSHSAVYFCAASTHVNNYDPAYFGSGTKLTVLDPAHQITEPQEVKVFEPSLKECRNKKDKQRKKTLVCVGSGFYPDHVNVIWKIDGVDATRVDAKSIYGVATDSAAKMDENNYRITSRLRVPAERWFTKNRNFTCIIRFFDGNTTTDHSGWILGVEDTNKGALTRDNYLKITQSAKLSYGVLIIKSCVYGAFVVFVVWKLQGSAGKHSN